LCCLAGAKYIKLSNPFDEAVDAACRAAPATCTKAQQQYEHMPLPALEQQLTDLIGPPHNYVGFPKPATAAAADPDVGAARASIHAEGSKDVAACAAPGAVLGLQLPASLGSKGAAGPAGINWLGPGLEKLAAAAEVRVNL
jgi:hypothetical protein